MNKKSLKRILAFTFALVIVVCACGCGAKKDESMDQAAEMEYSGNGLGGRDAYYEYSKSEIAESAAQKDKVDMKGNTNLIQDSIKSLGKENLKLIYTAHMELQTTDYAQAEEGLTKLVDSFGGYFESINVNNNGMFSGSSFRNGYYVVRVPAEKYADFINSVGDVYHVVSVNQNVQDVGEQYFEVEARLETLKTKRDRLNQLLKNAANLTDIIQLESELANTEYEIDNYTSTLNHYDSLIGYSTVNINVYEVARPSDGLSTDTSFGARIKRSFTRGLDRTAQGFEDFVLWAVSNIVGIIIFVAIVIALIKIKPISKIKRQIRKRKEEKQD